MNLCLWSVDGISIHKFALEAPILGCVLLPDDKVASFDNRKHIYVHDLQTKKMVKVSNSEVELSSMCSSKLGKPFALFLRKDGLLEMIDVRTMELVKVFKMKSYGNFVINATFGGEEEEFVASGSEGKFPVVLGRTEGVEMMLIFVGGDLYIWETGTGELLLKEKVHTAPESCNCIAWNPKMHGMIATAGDDHTVRM
jgi:WD40 repeat protein